MPVDPIVEIFFVELSEPGYDTFLARNLHLRQIMNRKPLDERPDGPAAIPSSMDGIDLVELPHGGVREIFATALPQAKENPASLLHRLHRALLERDGQVLEMRIFGAASMDGPITRTLRNLFGEIDWPLSFIEGAGCFGEDLAGIQVQAVAGPPVRSLRQEGQVVGRVFETEFAEYCILGDLRSFEAARSREAQTEDTIRRMMAVLASVGLEIHDVVRTWFFIDDILGWYTAFNGVRSEIYSEAGVFGRYLPASTGIGGRNHHGAAVLASCIGMRGKVGNVTVRELPSPLQCPAPDYGSSFSRAAELVTPDSRAVLVSGTASIDPDGVTAHVGDLDAQIRYTLDIVGAILDSRRMGYHDVVRGNAYFKHADGGVRLKEHADSFGLPASRIILSENKVCREDLLFELEVHAVRVGEPG